MKTHYTGVWQYWYDRSTRCWWAAKFDTTFGGQIGDAIHAYSRKEIEAEITKEPQ